MSKVRINDLARELEVKSRAILDTLPLVGVTEKKTHSSSLEEHEAEKVRVYIRSANESSSSAGKSARPSRGEDEIKTKIDLSHISRPGDVLKAITQRKEAVTAPVAPRAVPPPVTHAPAPQAPAEKPAAVPPAAVSHPTTVAPPVVKTPAAAPLPPSSASAPVVPPPERGLLWRHRSHGAASALYRYCSSGAASSSSGCDHVLTRRTGGFRRCSAGAPGEASCSATTGTAHDRSPNWAATGIQSAGASSVNTAAGAAGSSDWWRDACCSRTSGSRSADLSTPATDAGRGSCGRAASAASSWRASPHAPYAAGSSWSTAPGRGSSSSPSGDNPSRQPSRWAGAATRSALCSTRREGRPDEGLHAATAYGGVE